MTKKEFLKGLEDALLEHIDISEAASHIRYYQDYIENEVRNGREEQEVVNSLQNPRLIAKSLLNNTKSANKYKSNIYDYEKKAKTYNTYENSGTSNRGYGAQKTAPVTFSINGKPINSLILKIALLVLAIVLVLLVIAIVGGIIWLFTRFILPVALIGGFIYIIVKIIKNNI